MKICVESKSEAVLDKKHVLLPLLVMHARGIITKYKMVHDGTTVYQRIKNKKPSNKMLPFGEKVVRTMPKNYHRRNSRTVCRHRAKNKRARGSTS